MKIIIKGLPFLIDREDLKLIVLYNWSILPSNHTYYGRGNTGSKKILMHNLVFGKHPTLQVDHIDRNGWNNQKSNLRFVTPSINRHNSQIPRCNTSGVKGVSWYPSRLKWVVSITMNGKRIHLGYFEDFNEAVLTRVKAEEYYVNKARRFQR